ncbi:hypothetical protein [Lentilactobacillus kosonis]|uniref:DUF4822 domain-containing protein n=1 Tax=Lentilactobacillus kosonis TaxID=2810561 RepID=A0A401FI42_9LACO|nr:hypothetical protein [Lentilactobacillus kosonis]GAY72050.1 hypothetical protein NBRC111893_196 [Lentilactobacillus kosonis]
MKKVILWGTVVLGMFGILMTSTTTANAATWHKGVPTFLKSGFWTLNKPKHTYIKFSNQAIYDLVPDEGVFDGAAAKDPEYKKSGKTYVIAIKISKHLHFTYTIRKFSKDKASFHMSAPDGEHFSTHMTRINKLP